MTQDKKATKSSPLEKKIEKLERDLENFQVQLGEAKQGQLRALADLQNFQRREAENKKHWSALAVSDFLRKLLPKFVELNLSVEHTQDKDVAKTIRTFLDELKKSGLESIDPKVGEAVNPDLHEVVMAMDGVPGTVVQVLEPGWKYQDMVLSPAKISAPAA